jgi:hypothetical protein
MSLSDIVRKMGSSCLKLERASCHANNEEFYAVIVPVRRQDGEYTPLVRVLCDLVYAIRSVEPGALMLIEPYHNWEEGEIYQKDTGCTLFAARTDSQGIKIAARKRRIGDYPAGYLLKAYVKNLQSNGR